MIMQKLESCVSYEFISYLTSYLCLGKKEIGCSRLRKEMIDYN